MELPRQSARLFALMEPKVFKSPASKLPAVRAMSVALLFGLSAGTNPAAAATGPFANFDGSWSGDGTVTLAGGGKERLRCRAGYRVRGSGATELDLRLTCASDSYKFDFTGSASAGTGSAITGQWRENSRNVGGNISGQARGNRIQVLIESPVFAADLLMTTHSGRQSVALRSRSNGNGEATNVAITLRRHSR